MTQLLGQGRTVLVSGVILSSPPPIAASGNSPRWANASTVPRICSNCLQRAVMCVFGIFFVPDLHGAVRGLWRLGRPAGFLAITIWGAKMFEPADDKLWEAVRQEDPELLKSIKPWNKIVEPDPLRALLVECDVTDPVVVAEPGTHPLNTPEDWWTIILGSGYRSAVDALSPVDRERVRVTTIEAVRREKIREIRADVVYAIARRSPSSGRRKRAVGNAGTRTRGIHTSMLRPGAQSPSRILRFRAQLAATGGTCGQKRRRPLSSLTPTFRISHKIGKSPRKVPAIQRTQFGHSHPEPRRKSRDRSIEGKN